MKPFELMSKEELLDFAAKQRSCLVGARSEVDGYYPESDQTEGFAEMAEKEANKPRNRIVIYEADQVAGERAAKIARRVGFNEAKLIKFRIGLTDPDIGINVAEVGQRMNYSKYHNSNDHTIVVISPSTQPALVLAAAQLAIQDEHSLALVPPEGDPVWMTIIRLPKLR